MMGIARDEHVIPVFKISALTANDLLGTIQGVAIRTVFLNCVVLFLLLSTCLLLISYLRVVILVMFIYWAVFQCHLLLTVGFWGKGARYK